jgi:hypothetical protein
MFLMPGMVIALYTCGALDKVGACKGVDTVMHWGLSKSTEILTTPGDSQGVCSIHWGVYRVCAALTGACIQVAGCHLLTDGIACSVHLWGPGQGGCMEGCVQHLLVLVYK